MIENRYLGALFQAWSIFIQEESRGRVFAEYRLKNAIEQARKDFADDKEAMIGAIETKDLTLRPLDCMNTPKL